MFTIRKRLSATEGAPANTRVNPETGEVETSPDGGTTWNPDPNSDPRINPAYMLPPTPEGNCAAAAGMIVAMQQWVAQASTVVAPGGLATALLGGFLLLIPGFGWMYTVALIVAGAIATIGGAAIGTAFTNPVWDALLCILYCHVDAQGQVDQAGLDAIQAEITADIGGVVAQSTALMFQTWGFVGLNNAGVLNANPAADCDDCLCEWCVYFDFRISSYGDVWEPFDIYGQYVPDNGWQRVANQGLILQGNFPTSDLTRVVWGGVRDGGGGPFSRQTHYFLGATEIFNDNQPGISNGIYQCISEQTLTVNQLWLHPTAGSTADVYIQDCWIYGTGDPPAIGVPC